MSAIYQGGCHCGQLRYAVSTELQNIAHCHCSICRRTSGGIVTTWLTVPLTSFSWLRGAPAEYASSATCTRYFCPGCGAQLALFTTLSSQTMDVTVATLDHPEAAPADRHIWISSRLPWLQLDLHLPEEDQELL